ncbi:MAG: hypothetical protein RRC07_10985 [Anaerolineae bacterium]|nr:hypothetical protein [Anaerolineae bacterium]
MKQFIVGMLVTIVLGSALFALYQATQAEGAAAPAPTGALPAASAAAAVHNAPVAVPETAGEVERQALPAPAVAVQDVAPAASAQQAGNGYGQQTTNTTPGTPQIQAQTYMTTPFVTTGTIQAVELTGISLLTSVGEPLWVQLGPSHFWSTQGVVFGPGDQVTVDGFVENDQIQAISVSNDTTGQLLTLRDASGRPLWAGGNGNAGNGGNGYRGGQG